MKQSLSMLAISLATLLIIIIIQRVGGQEPTDNKFNIGALSGTEVQVNFNRFLIRFHEFLEKCKKSFLNPKDPGQKIFINILVIQVLPKSGEILADAFIQYKKLKLENSKS